MTGRKNYREIRNSLAGGGGAILREAVVTRRNSVNASHDHPVLRWQRTCDRHNPQNGGRATRLLRSFRRDQRPSVATNAVRRCLLTQDDMGTAYIIEFCCTAGNPTVIIYFFPPATAQ